MPDPPGIKMPTKNRKTAITIERPVKTKKNEPIIRNVIVASF